MINFIISNNLLYRGSTLISACLGKEKFFSPQDTRVGCYFSHVHLQAKVQWTRHQLKVQISTGTAPSHGIVATHCVGRACTRRLSHLISAAMPRMRFFFYLPPLVSRLYLASVHTDAAFLIEPWYISKKLVFHVNTPVDNTNWLEEKNIYVSGLSLDSTHLSRSLVVQKNPKSPFS